MSARSRYFPAVALALGTFASTLAAAECRTSPQSATGEPKKDIEAATQSAYDALAAKIKSSLGPQWTPGSRRGAEYTCVKPMGGPAGRLTWTCSLRSYPCRP